MFDKIDKSKLTKNELVVQKAREDIKAGKITLENFSKIKSKYGDHIRFTIDEYLAIPFTGKMCRISTDEEIKVGDWCLILNVRGIKDGVVEKELKMCEII